VGITAGTSTPEDIINQVHSEIVKIAKEVEGIGEQALHS
jgi:4-hydroxy-3-methylbut-2-enyl diphosphate reductase IspH